jgi:hypothetical protein
MHVIQNRVKDRRWGGTYHSVLGGWAQFSCLWEELDSVNFQSCIEVANALEHGAYPIGESGRIVKQIEWVVDGVLEGALIENTFGSTHYFYTGLPKPPYWARPPGVRMVTIGRHEFWLGVP